MKVLVIEDDEKKYNSIERALLENAVDVENIFRIHCLKEFYVSQNNLSNIDLCILDFFLPTLVGEKAENAFAEVLKTLDKSNMGSIPVIAITSHLKEFADRRSELRQRGIITYSYEEENIWAAALKGFVEDARQTHKYDFIGITALREERDGFVHCPEVIPRKKSVIGLDAWEVVINGEVGCLFCPPRMGLVDMACLTSRILENFNPRVIFLSGICGGFSDTELGQLLITDLCWEYQSGKWLEEVFKSEPYQVAISESLRARFRSQLDEEDDLVRLLERDVRNVERPSKIAQPTLSVFASGSAVISSSERLAHVERQHRKVLGIDMEVFGFHRAVELSQRDVVHYSAKVVVDKADVNKDDRLHEYGSAISARFCLDWADKLLNF